MTTFRRRKPRLTKNLPSNVTPLRRNDWNGPEQENLGRPRNRGIYLLPNAFTTANLFCGFFAIVQAMNQRFEIAAIAIFVALVMDGMDGRVARMTNTQSAFGEQYDSLTDMVSFGVAPALIAYEWVLKDLGKWGWLAVDNKLPVKELALPWFMFALTIYAGITMVSNAMFYSGKALDVRYRAPFGVMILVILGFVLVSSDPPVALFGLFVAYALSGYVFWVWQKIVLPKKKASDMLSDN